MRWHDNAPYDFSLVSTYFPILFLIIRSTCFVCVIFWISTVTNLRENGIVIITTCVVYLDSIFFHEQHFDRACGHLCVCALSFVTQQHQSVCGNSQNLILLGCDLLWSACVSVEVILRTTRTLKDSQHLQKIFVCCIFICMRVILNCDRLGFMEALLRTFLYNLVCAILLFCSTLMPHSDAILHSNAVVFLCAHIAFVHLYAVLASILFIVCVHGRLVYSKIATNTLGTTTLFSQKNAEATSSTTRTAPHKEYNDMLLVLQAAKRAASGSV